MLFNTAISGNNKYPSAGNSPEHVSFDKIDLGEVIFGTIISLKDGCTAQIKTAKEYLVFKNNIIPGYNRLTDELIVNLNSLFAQQTGEIEFLLMLMVGISGILIFISMIAFSLSIIRAISSFRALIELYVQLDDFLVRKIEDYIHEVTGIFKHLNEKNEEKSRGIKEKSIKLRSLKKIKMKA